MPDDSLHDHSLFMRRALALAERGLYTTTPNPRVGCVIVADDGRILGEGFTQPAGQNHAEVQALNDAQSRGENVRGATAYVTLEPCSHFGRTPPCCNALIAAGISHVVAAIEDPNPKVSGAGFKLLQDAGIKITMGVLADEATEINRGFIKRMRTGRPLVRIKIAASLDGRTALANGESKWITSEASRADVHHWRARSCAILTGIGTILADDPQLNVRGIDTPRQPVKVITDTSLRTPHTAKILQSGHTLIAHASSSSIAPPDNAELIQLSAENKHLALPALLDELGRRGFNEVMTEAGATLNGALVAQGLADELLLYSAPLLLGPDARAMLQLPAFKSLSDAQALDLFDVARIGSDLRLQLRFQGPG